MFGPCQSSQKRLLILCRYQDTESPSEGFEYIFSHASAAALAAAASKEGGYSVFDPEGIHLYTPSYGFPNRGMVRAVVKVSLGCEWRGYASCMRPAFSWGQWGRFGGARARLGASA